MVHVVARAAARNSLNLVAGRIALVLLLACAAFSGTAPGPAQAQSYSFTQVQIEGAARVEPGTIVSYAAIPRGQAVSAAQLNDAYQRIVASNLFEVVEFVPSGSTLIIRVQEWPTINRINFEGNSRLKDEALASFIESRPRRIYSPTQAEQDAATLVEAYEENGRLAATVTPRIIRRDGNRVDLVFEIAEGRVVEIERLSFVGNAAYSDRRLRQVLETKQAGLLRQIVQRDTFVEQRLEFDKQLLVDFYRARGFVDFRVLGVASEFSRDRNAFFITFTVEEGPSFDFGQITARSDVPGVEVQDFLDVVRSRPGQTYSPTAVENDIARMERLALRKGLNFLRVEPVVNRNDRAQTLDVEYVISRGPRIFVERIDIEGNQTTLDRVIRRQFRVVEGDPFNPREIRQAAERIRALNYFETTDVQAVDGSAGDQVIVDVNVAEAPTGSLSFGGSYSLDNGPGLNASFSERNFLGRGQTLRFDVSFGTDASNSQITFIEPFVLGRDLEFSFRAFYLVSEKDNTFYNTQIAGLSPELEFPVSENGRLAVRYLLSEDRVYGVDAGSSAILQAEAGSKLTSALGYTYSYDTRRTGLNPTAGVLLEFGQDFAGLGGDTEYVKTEARAVAQRLVMNEEVTLRATVEGGALNMLNGGTSRVTDRFFLSTNQLRGFDVYGLGPRDTTAPNNDALGGNFFAVARLEAEFPLGLPEEYGISGGVFLDAGSVWGLDNTAGTGGAVDDDFHLRSSIGVSLFWDTPIGPLRFNWAHVLQKEAYDETRNFNLTISTEF
jgi:outer membrane protein insertion porin family